MVGSSDSEDDDCYGNVALKLQRMKNNYKIQNANLLNDSTESNENVNKSTSDVKKETVTRPTTMKDENLSDNEELDSLLADVLDKTTALVSATSSKRTTRSSAKRANSDVSIESSAHKRGNKRKKGGRASRSGTTTDNSPDSVQNAIEIASPQNSSSGPVPRGRGRGRGRSRGRNRRQTHINTFWNIPTYSVGNTEEYPDHSNCQVLFSEKPKSDDVVIVEDTDVLDENEELSVKVYWQSSEYFKFTIRRFQKLTQIFDYFAKKENVSHDKLLFTYNDQILKSDDTPDSIKYSFVKFIDGGIVNQSVSNLIKDDRKRNDQNGIKIKFQCQNVKKPFETCISPDEKLAVAMMKCAEHFEISLDKLRFQFDGDFISGKTTAKELELEGGECIDVKIIS